MNLITKLFSRAEKAYLTAKILSVRPDLADKPREGLIDVFIFWAIIDFVEAERQYDESPTTSVKPKLSSLLKRAIAYQSTKSKAYYHTQYLLYKRRCEQLQMENLDYSVRSSELSEENREAYKIARLATNIVESIKNPVGKLN